MEAREYVWGKRYRVGLGVDDRLHALVVQGVALEEVDDVELVGDTLASVLDAKVKPGR